MRDFLSSEFAGTSLAHSSGATSVLPDILMVRINASNRKQLSWQTLFKDLCTTTPENKEANQIAGSNKFNEYTI